VKAQQFYVIFPLSLTLSHWGRGNSFFAFARASFELTISASGYRDVGKRKKNRESPLSLALSHKGRRIFKPPLPSMGGCKNEVLPSNRILQFFYPDTVGGEGKKGGAYAPPP
jgi:hypothetical protein